MSALILEFGRGSLPRLGTHRNPGLEIVYILRGHLLWHTQGRVEQVPPESVFFTLPEQEHGSAQEFEPGHEWVFVVLSPDSRKPRSRQRLLNPALHFSTKEALEITTSLYRAKRHAFRATDGMKWALPALVSEMEHPAALHAAKISSLARTVVVELIRSIHAGQEATLPNVRSGVENRVRKLILHLAAHPGETRTLGQMAAQCRLSRTQFAKIFHEQTGDTPMKFVNRMRIRNACRRLRETSLPITRIAMECGFGTSQYFAKIFKTFTGGMDARSYRKAALSFAPEDHGHKRRSKESGHT